VSERLQTSISSVGSRNSLFGAVPLQPLQQQIPNNSKQVAANRFKAPTNYNFIGENSLHILKENFFKKANSISSVYHELKNNTNANKFNVKSINIAEKLSLNGLNEKNIKLDNKPVLSKHIANLNESKVFNIDYQNELKSNKSIKSINIPIKKFNLENHAKLAVKNQAIKLNEITTTVSKDLKILSQLQQTVTKDLKLLNDYQKSVTNIKVGNTLNKEKNILKLQDKRKDLKIINEIKMSTIKNDNNNR